MRNATYLRCMSEAKKVLKEIFSLSFKGKKVTLGESVFRFTITIIFLSIAKFKFPLQSDSLDFLQTLIVCTVGIFIAKLTYPTFNRQLNQIKQRRD